MWDLDRMILLIQNIEDYNNDFRVSLQAFYGGERIIVPEIFEKKPELKREVDKVFAADIREQSIEIKMYAGTLEDDGKAELAEAVIDAVISGEKPDEAPVCSSRVDIDGDSRDKAVVRNPLKLAIYEMLSAYTGRTLPWGSLTGIRPTKIAVAQIEDGEDRESVISNYINVYGTSRAKAELAFDVAGREKMIIDSVAEEDEYCLYIGIPFCPTRCLYCSFTSYPIAVYKDKVEAYLDALEKEMEYVAEAYSRKKLISIYIGGEPLHPYRRRIWTDSAA
ncbi:MAG: hypothetical protein ACLTDF_07125 [Coprococcus sp.]